MKAPVASVRVKSEDMARVCANGLAFLPARAKEQHARLVIREGRLTITATDSFTVGRDWCEGEADGGATVYVARGALSELDRMGRSDKKGHGILSVRDDGGSLFFSPSEGSDLAVESVSTLDSDLYYVNACAPWEESGKDTVPVWGDVFPLVDALMDRLDSLEPTADLPRVIAFDPALFARFAKVKTDKASRVMDCLCFGEHHPMLVKIGPTFTGAIMPIERAGHAAKVGEDGMW